MQLKFGAADVRLLDDDEVFSGYYRVRRLTLEHRAFAGGWADPITRELFERGDAVGVLPWDVERDELVLIEQFRVGAMRGDASPWMFEIVAGIVEPGESDDEVARRETAEESGLALLDLAPSVSFFPSPGACSEHVRLFVGRVDAAAAGGLHGCADEGEDIRVHRLPREDVMAMVDANQISNGHTLMSLLWLRVHGDALRQRWLG
ncbi:MAG: NUDIX domain-containing protein [Halieaceae bacterium]|jgi:ADP-ribose pyrophosphatase|nr:NUDIX domain-containing protein [Halieaceae bacterium]